MTLHDHDRIVERLAAVADPIRFLANLFEHAPVGFAVWDSHGYTLLTNRAFMDIFLSEPPPEYNVLEDPLLAANGMLPLFQRAFAGETVTVPTFWYDPRELTNVHVESGRRVAVSMTIFPLLGKDGEIEHVAATYKDETEPLLAAERARASERRLLLAQQVAQVGTFELDLRTGLNIWTPELEAMYGLRRGEFGASQQSWEALVHPDDRSEAIGRVRSALATMSPTEGEWRVIWPDGSVHWLVGRFQAFADESGAVRRLIGVNVDVTARRRADLALRDSEADLRITLQSIGDAVIATDRAGRVTRMNPVAELLTGWPLGEALGRELHEVFRIVREETREPVESPVDRVFREGAVVGLANHTLLIARDGIERAIADSGAPIRDVDGRLRGVVLVFHDQTADRNVQRALQRSEGRFRRLVEAGIIGILSLDIFGNVLDANEAFLRLVGYTAEEVRSRAVRWIDMTPREWIALDDRAIVQLEQHGAADPYEKEYLRRDGTRVPVLVGMALLDRESGECIAFVLDLTAQKRAEAALRESKAIEAAVMEAALDAIVVMDHEGRIAEFNPAAERTLGYTRDEVLGKPLAEVVIPPSARDAHHVGLHRHLATGEVTILGRRIEVQAMRKGGEEFPAEVAVVRIRSHGPPVFTGYIRDVTERRRAAEAELLRREKEAVEAANRELEAFSYTVAHDLRAPVRGIGGFVGMLLEDHGDRIDDEGKALLAKVTANAKRMADLIDGLLALSRLSRVEVQRGPVDLGDLAVRIVDRLRATEPSRDVELVVHDGLVVQGDARLLGSLVENLVGNAWKFTRPRTRARIELGSAPTPAGTAFYIRDNGAGFDMTYAARLFTPFHRLHAAEQFEGTGIGLATVQRVVHRHGGRVWADSEEGKGATFWFTIPEKAAARGVQAPQ